MRRYRLIIADDEKLIRDSLAGFIDWEKLGFELVLLAEDGQEIIDKMDSLKPDVILTDIQMRGTSGLQVAEYAAKKSPDTVLVLLSGYREFEYAQKAIRFGVEEYLLKPISITGIREAFEKIRLKLEERDQKAEKDKEMEQELSAYREAAVEKLFELGRMGAITEEICRSYMEKFGMASMENNVVCHEAELVTEPFNSYEELAGDILNNLFQMVAKDYGLLRIYIFSENGDGVRRIVLMSGVGGNSFDESEWLEEMERDILEISHTRAKLRMIQKDIPFVEYVVGLKNESMKTAPGTENSEAWLQALANQCVMLLNMAPAAETVMDGIWDTLQGWLQEKKASEKAEAINRYFAVIRRKIDALNEGRHGKREWSSLSPADGSRTCFDRNIREIYEALQMEKEESLSVVERVRRLIADNITGNISLKQAADSVYLSPNYFSTLFREQSGENFSEYSIRVKMEKAAEMLRETRYRVYEISDYLGYKNIKYFYKLFKRIHNMTPMEYREQFWKGGI